MDMSDVAAELAGRQVLCMFTVRIYVIRGGFAEAFVGKLRS